MAQFVHTIGGQVWRFDSLRELLLSTTSAPAARVSMLVTSCTTGKANWSATTLAVTRRVSNSA